MMHKAFSSKLPHNIQSYITKSFSGNEHRIRQWKLFPPKNIFKQLLHSIVHLILGLKCGITKIKIYNLEIIEAVLREH